MNNTKPKARFFAQIDPSQVFELFNLLPSVSFFVKDRQGQFVALNQRGCDYCGVANEEEAIGKTDFDFFPKQRAERYMADDRCVMETGQPIINRVESAPEAAGSPRLVMTTKIPIFSKKGAVVGTAGFSRQVDQLRDTRETITAFSKAIKRMHESFDKRLSSAELANLAGLSVSQFERKFRSAFGTSVRQYLLRIRIEQSARLLEQTEKSISQIALACGFFDHAHFSRCFKKQMNQSPSEFRKRRT